MTHERISASSDRTDDLAIVGYQVTHWTNQDGSDVVLDLTTGVWLVTAQPWLWANGKSGAVRADVWTTTDEYLGGFVIHASPGSYGSAPITLPLIAEEPTGVRVEISFLEDGANDTGTPEGGVTAGYSYDQDTPAGALNPVLQAVRVAH